MWNRATIIVHDGEDENKIIKDMERAEKSHRREVFLQVRSASLCIGSFLRRMVNEIGSAITPSALTRPDKATSRSAANEGLVIHSADLAGLRVIATTAGGALTAQILNRRYFAGGPPL
jgi:hypothetical protein